MGSRFDDRPLTTTEARGAHLGRRELRRLAAGELTQAETTEVSKHLIDCADCRKRVRGLRSAAAGLFHELFDEWEDRAWITEISPGDLVPTDPGTVGSRPQVPARAVDDPDLLQRSTVVSSVSSDMVSSDMVSSEHPRDRSVSLLLTELDELPPEERLPTLRRCTSYHRRDVAELLLASSWEARMDDAFFSEERAVEALAVLENLGSDFDELHEIEDLRARGWAYRGNALRIRHRLHRAEEAFEKAETHLSRGTRDPNRRAEILLLRGSLLREQHRFEEAHWTFDQVLAIHRWTGNRERQCECLISKANTYDLQGDPDRALQTLEQAAELLKPSFDPFLAVCVQENRAGYLVQVGRPEEAAELLPEVREFVDKAGIGHGRLRVRWLEGRLASALGRVEEAERLLRQVSEEFLAEDLPYDSAQSTLDLVALLLEQGRTREAKELARDMIQVFDALDIQRESFTALLMFQKAVLEETATVQMARDLAQQLSRIQANPALCHEKPS